MRLRFLFLISYISISLFTNTCNHSTNKQEEATVDGQPNTIVKRRDDGTVSSVNQVDELGRVHGVRVTYFSDGKTIFTKFTFKHGKKEGASVRYYDNGQIFEHASFKGGKRDGLTRKYHKSGELLAEFKYRDGIALPGLLEYDITGNQLTSYPEIHFREMNHLASKNRIDLEIYSPEKKRGIKYYLIETIEGERSRTYLISEKSAASLQYYVKPGDSLNKKVEIEAQIPTELGNTMIQIHSYNLTVSH